MVGRDNHKGVTRTYFNCGYPYDIFQAMKFGRTTLPYEPAYLDNQIQPQQNSFLTWIVAARTFAASKSTVTPRGVRRSDLSLGSGF